MAAATASRLVAPLACVDVRIGQSVTTAVRPIEEALEAFETLRFAKVMKVLIAPNG
nr:hypothetical protein OG999_01505 [Streptomyces sp. NBC_00886]